MRPFYAQEALNQLFLLDPPGVANGLKSIAVLAGDESIGSLSFSEVGSRTRVKNLHVTNLGKSQQCGHVEDASALPVPVWNLKKSLRFFPFPFHTSGQKSTNAPDNNKMVHRLLEKLFIG